MHIKIIENYQPKNEQEKVDKEAMLFFARNNNNSLFRDNKIAHFTSSAIITNKERNKVLFVYHLIYQSWSWVGGHNDGDDNFLEVAIREAKEETGLLDVRPLLFAPVSLENIYVKNHFKNDKFIGDHIHMNLTYLLEADEIDNVIIKSDENSGVRWFLINEVFEFVSEERMKDIYQKIFDVIGGLNAK